VRGEQQTPAYEKALRKRQVWVEPLFAEAKEWHGLRRFRLRRLWRVNSEALLIAAGQNLKRLLQRHGWGRRPVPRGAALALTPLDGVIAASLRCHCHFVVASPGKSSLFGTDQMTRRAGAITDVAQVAAEQQCVTTFSTCSRVHETT
jgi:hypothetical protein